LIHLTPKLDDGVLAMSKVKSPSLGGSGIIEGLGIHARDVGHP